VRDETRFVLQAYVLAGLFTVVLRLPFISWWRLTRTTGSSLPSPDFTNDERTAGAGHFLNASGCQAVVSWVLYFWLGERDPRSDLNCGR